MRVLWLSNFILPSAAKCMGLSFGNKEGWVGALWDCLAEAKEDITLACAFPLEEENLSVRSAADGDKTYYAFYENTTCPENYDASLEDRLKEILADFKPDVIHVFGTEYPHAKALLRVAPDPSKVLIGIQGVMGPITEAYYASLPKCVIRRKTFRDLLKRDNLEKQKKKMLLRAQNEAEVLKLAYHVAGRTDFDHTETQKINQDLTYHYLGENLRDTFYIPSERCEEKGRIFLSQANYPLKGGHFAIAAMKAVVNKHPEAMLYIGGDSIKTADGIMNRIKRGSYASYLRYLIRKNGLKEHVVFLGMLSREEMKAEYLKAQVTLCVSSMENSPNSIGEAMLLRTTVIASRVGGVGSVISEKEGVMLPPLTMEASSLKLLSDAILSVLDGEIDTAALTENAYARALKQYDRDLNRDTLVRIYKEIMMP